MAKPGMTPVQGKKPGTRKISMRSAVTHIAGQEASYPAYRFGGKLFLERPNHNPFAGIPADPDPVVDAFDSGFDGGFE